MPSRAKNKRLIVYGSRDCIPCERAVSYLKEMGIDFIYIDVDENEMAAEEVEIFEGGDLLLPLIVDAESEQISIGCSVEKEKFSREISRLLEN